MWRHCTDEGEFPETLIVATTEDDFRRLLAKYDLEICATGWSRPGGALYGVRVPKIVVSAAVLAAPPPEFAGWVQRSLLCRLAVDGEYIEEAADDAPEDKK